MVGNLKYGKRGVNQPSVIKSSWEADAFAVHQVTEARIVVIEEAKASLALNKCAITAYLESNGDKFNLANAPVILQAVRGALWFIGLKRAALLAGVCADYIRQSMIETPQIPSEQMLEILADTLIGLEYYLESVAASRLQEQPDVLNLVSESVRMLGRPVAA